MPSELFTKKTLAAFLEVGEWTVGQWQRTGYLPKPFKLGTQLRWRRADIDRWIEKKAKAPYVPKAMHGVIARQAGRSHRVRLGPSDLRRIRQPSFRRTSPS